MARASGRSQNRRRDALGVAMRLLAVRPYGVREMTAKLSLRGFDAEEVDRTIASLTGAGYMDDAAYARALAASRARNKHWGPARITAELTAKGVAADIVKKTLQEQFGQSGLSEGDAARAAFGKWLKKAALSLPLDRRQLARAVRFLTSRGYSTALSLQVALESSKSAASGHDGE